MAAPVNFSNADGAEAALAGALGKLVGLRYLNLECTRNVQYRVCMWCCSSCTAMSR